MPNNREILANNIAERFMAAISGTEKNQWIYDNPENRIFVGKLSPQSSEDSLTSRTLIKQISVDFRIAKQDIENATLKIYPQGNFFYRVLPTLEQQRKFFVENLVATFTEPFFTDFNSFIEAMNGEGELPEEMKAHKVQLLPVYEKIAIDRDNVCYNLKLSDIYDSKFGHGSIHPESNFYKELKHDIDALCLEAKGHTNIMTCQFRDKIIVEDLLTEETWQTYIKRQTKREEFEMFLNFDFLISVDLKSTGDYLSITVALSNETQWGDESAGFGQIAAKTDNYRINTLFNSGLKIQCLNTEFVPLELDYFIDDYKYDRFVYALGNNCNVLYDEDKVEIQTTHIPCFVQHRLKTNDKMSVKFEDLLDNPIKTLQSIHSEMKKELARWESDYSSRHDTLTPNGAMQFSNEIAAFKLETARFATGIELIDKYNIIKDAFLYMNQSFRDSAKSKGYNSWRLFQIVFIVSLILDVVSHEKDLMLDDDIKGKSKINDVDILYFPTGGGKTEAFLGVLVFNLFFDRLRGKECGVTAMLKYPLRLLSVQQVQRVSNILATAELIRQAKEIGGDVFSLGYYVGSGNTPNRINRELQLRLLELSTEEMDDKYRLIDICPFCGQETIHVTYDSIANSLQHICENKGCKSQGIIPLFMVDNDIYRYLPSVIISTVDKIATIGLNSSFHNIIFGAKYKCPIHGFSSKNKCIEYGCQSNPIDFKKVSMKDPSPTLMIQDELHLIRESLGAYNAHYETLFEYFIKELTGSKRGLKVIGATATISAYREHSNHLYWKNAIRFPAASPYLKHNFYSFIDENDVGRIIIGYAPYGKAIVNSVAYALQYLKRVVWTLYENPEEVLNFSGISIQGTKEEQIADIKQLLEDYWIILEYNNVKLESNRVLQALEDPINTELIAEEVQPLIAKKMTGDDSFQEVRSTLSTIEHAESLIDDIDFNMIAATSMISHGVDADRFNLMLFYGIPDYTAEYIQAYSRVGRKHTGIVIDIMRPSREKDQSYLKNFVKFHEYKDILVDSVSINRWATKAVEHTLPGVISALILNYYLYQLQNEEGVGDISKYSNLKEAFNENRITADGLKEHAYNIYKCSDSHSSIGKLYRQTIDKLVDRLVDNIKNGSFSKNDYIIDVFNQSYFKIMRSLRNTDKQLIVEIR